jgi:hypothetical protein
MRSYYDWVYCCCRPSVNIICGRIITDDNNNKSNHNTTTYYVYCQTATTTTQSRYDHILCLVLLLGCRCCRPSVSTICGRIMIGLSLLPSGSKHTMWSYYDWVYCCCRPTDRRQQRQSNHNTTTYYVYWRTTTTINPIIIRPHCIFTYAVVLWLGCRCCRLSVNIQCGRIMIGFIVVVVRQ